MSAVASVGSTELQTKDSAKQSSDAAHIAVPSDAPSPNGNEASSEVEPKRYFESSSHSFFIYFMSDPEGKRNLSGLIVALFVIAMQTGLYTVCALDIFSKLVRDGEYTIPVQVLFGRSCEKPGNLKCPPELSEWEHSGLAAVLLAFFMMYDIVATIKIMMTVKGRWAKFAAFCVFLEALFGTVVACMFALEARSGYDAVVNCIGILFIHDVDEKAFDAFEVLEVTDKCKAKCKCCKFFGKTELAALFIVSFVTFMAVFAAGSSIRSNDIAGIEESYGKNWFEKNFGDDGYDYGWDTEYSFYEFHYGTGSESASASGSAPGYVTGAVEDEPAMDKTYSPTPYPTN